MKQENLSISNSDWSKFLTTLIAVTIGTMGFLYLSIYLIDPYDMLMFSPETSRSLITYKRRLGNPGIARKAQFDSFIIGTSTVMLLKPQRLDHLLHAKIANLSVPAATPYEQMRMASLFMEYHDELNLVIVSIDLVWCTIDGNTRYIDVHNDKEQEERRIQEWMYSSNFWQQLPPLNRRIFKHTRKQLKAIFGSRTPKYNANGYGNFTEYYAKNYDQARIQKNLYGDSEPTLKMPLQPAIKVNKSKVKTWRFSDIEMLKKWLVSLPPSTRKILLFPPYHHYKQAQIGSENEVRWNECKNRVTNISLTVPHVTVLDFMIRSPITIDDSNYFDSVHYTVEIANKIEDTLGFVVMGQSTGEGGQTDEQNSTFFKVLNRPM